MSKRDWKPVHFKTLKRCNTLLELDAVLTLSTYKPSFVFYLILKQIANI